MAASHTSARGLFLGRESATFKPLLMVSFLPDGSSARAIGRAGARLTSLGLDVSQRLPQQPLVHGLAEKHTAGRNVVTVRSALARHTMIPTGGQ